MTDVAKKMKLHRNWMIPGVEEFNQQLREDLKTQLAEDSLSGLGTAADLLGMLATYQGIRGLIAVDDGVETGWGDLANAISLGLFSNRAPAERHRRAVDKKGFKAEVRPRLVDETFYWLDFRTVDDGELPPDVQAALARDYAGVKLSSLECRSE